MHSLAIAQYILRAALAEAEKNNVQSIRAIEVRMSDEHFAEPDALRFCLEAEAAGTIAQDALIDVTLMERMAECQDCSLIFADDRRILNCPRCGGRRLEFLPEDGPIRVLLRAD